MLKIVFVTGKMTTFSFILLHIGSLMTELSCCNFWTYFYFVYLGSMLSDDSRQFWFLLESKYSVGEYIILYVTKLSCCHVCGPGCNSFCTRVFVMISYITNTSLVLFTRLCFDYVRNMLIQ